MSTLLIVYQLDLDFIFDRMDFIIEKNIEAGGITGDRILDGSAFNREIAFDQGYYRYASRESWLIGYGWGIGDNNRHAFYVDPSIPRGSAHSQIFAVLFIFGWIGFIAYFGLYLRIIWKSFTLIILNTQSFFTNRLFAYFSMIMSVLFLINQIKVDSISYPTYFGFTIILLGLAYANLNSVRYLSDNH